MAGERRSRLGRMLFEMSTIVLPARTVTARLTAL
jgi:hypothetical protein